MPTATQPQLSSFAMDVAEGLSRSAQKKIPPRYFYDALGTSLFEAITLLPEYGLTRADMRLLTENAAGIAGCVGSVARVAELGSGNGSKARPILEALRRQTCVAYHPIDVSSEALAVCKSILADVADVKSVCADWIDGLTRVTTCRAPDEPLLVLFLGSSIGNLDRGEIPDFLRVIRSLLHPGDFFLLGADLVKDVETMLAAYDDAAGVTAAFNLNLLGRINRELTADFDLRSFAHEVRWNSAGRRIEMHLVSCRNQSVYVAALDTTIRFSAGETIWTESSHKFTPGELDAFARDTGFMPLQMWIDEDWAFAEALWRAR